MNERADARAAFLALCGYHGSTLDTPLHRYGAAAPSPDTNWLREQLEEIGKMDPQSPSDWYTWVDVVERGKAFALIMLVGHFYNGKWGYDDEGTYRHLGYERMVTVGVGLSPRTGTCTPGRAWKKLSPWREGGGYRSIERIRGKVEGWTKESAPDRVTFAYELLPTMLAALNDSEGGA